MAEIVCKICGKNFTVSAYAVGRRKMCSDACRAKNNKAVSKVCMAAYRATDTGKAAYKDYNKRYKRVTKFPVE